MRCKLAAIVLLLAPVGARAQFRLDAPFVDHSQAGAIRSAASLHCRQIHLEHGAGRSPDDCVMIDPRTMELRIGPAGDPESWAQHLEAMWCEGNRYVGTENRFQFRTESSCAEVCERSEEDRACVTKADIGRAARRKAHAWKNVGTFRLVERPRERAPRCEGDDEYAEAWRVVMLNMDAVPGVRMPDSIPFSGDREITVQVICADGVQIREGTRFRALAGESDVCEPWREAFIPCLTAPEPIED
jgi:hypothetical protein